MNQFNFLADMPFLFPHINFGNDHTYRNNTNVGHKPGFHVTINMVDIGV